MGHGPVLYVIPYTSCSGKRICFGWTMISVSCLTCTSWGRVSAAAFSHGSVESSVQMPYPLRLSRTVKTEVVCGAMLFGSVLGHLAMKRKKPYR